MEIQPLTKSPPERESKRRKMERDSDAGTGKKGLRKSLSLGLPGR